MRKVTTVLPKKRVNRLKRTAKRLAAYSAAAAVTVMTTQNRSADADEVIWDIPDQVIPSGNGIQFNIISGNYSAATQSYGAGEASFRIGSAFFPGFLEVAGQASNTAGVGFVGAIGGGYSYFYVSNLTAGAMVGDGLTFGASASGANPSFGPYAFLSSDPGGLPLGDTRGFFGVQFEIAGETHYGWVEVSGLNAGPTLHSFGYNDTAGAASIVGGGTAVPEPSSVMLLAAGAAGLAAWRRRHKTA